MKKLLLMLVIALMPLLLSAEPHEMKIVPDWILASDSLAANEFMLRTAIATEPSGIRWSRCGPCHSGSALETEPLPDNHAPIDDGPVTIAFAEPEGIRWNRCGPCHSGGALEAKPLPDNHQPID
jgi:hypothetical protein